MKALWYFFKLIRIINILVIALTMAVFQYFLSGNNLHSLYDSYFLLLVFSVCLIASAGNIINDYFDVKADRINKPESLIIDVHIKRRWAIVFNWLFNFMAFSIALFLSWKLKSLFMIVVPSTAIILLWLYSMYLKRTLIVGNVVVAFLTGLVPLYVLLLNQEFSLLDAHGHFVLLFALYAFGLNLIREIIKDVADVKGDLLLNSKTIPIVWGNKSAKFIVLFLSLVGMIPLVYYGLKIIQTNEYFLAFWFTLLVVICMLLSNVFLFFTHERKYMLTSSNLLKLAMFFGLMIPLVL